MDQGSCSTTLLTSRQKAEELENQLRSLSDGRMNESLETRLLRTIGSILVEIYKEVIDGKAQSKARR